MYMANKLELDILYLLQSSFQKIIAIACRAQKASVIALK